MSAPVSMIGYASGKVQGVWFRYFVQQQAQPLGITGYAKNLEDGRVEILLCGFMEEITRVQKAVASGPPNARVDNVQWQATHERASGDFMIL